MATKILRTNEEILQSVGTFIPNDDLTEVEAIYTWKAREAMDIARMDSSISFLDWAGQNGFRYLKQQTKHWVNKEDNSFTTEELYNLFLKEH